MTKEKTEELLMCPLCDGMTNGCFYQEEMDRWEIYCLGCGCTILKPTYEETVKAWNTRPKIGEF